MNRRVVMRGVALYAILAAAGSSFANASDAANASSIRSVAARSVYADDFSKRPTTEALSQLGRLLFFEPALSASAKVSCASCHDPEFAFGPPNALAVQRGGIDGRRTG